MPYHKVKKRKRGFLVAINNNKGLSDDVSGLFSATFCETEKNLLSFPDIRVASYFYHKIPIFLFVRKFCG